VHRGDGVDDAIGAYLFGVVGQDRHTGAHTGFDDDRLAVEIALDHRADLVRGAWHHRADHDTLDLVAQATLRQKPVDNKREFVGGTPRVSADPPVLDEFGVLEDTHHGVGVADIEREQHAQPARPERRSSRSTPISRIGAECVNAPTAM